MWGQQESVNLGAVLLGVSLELYRKKESNVVGMDVSHSIGKRSSGVGIVKDGQIFCTYSFCYIYCPGREDVPENRKRSANGCPATYKSTHSGCANIFKSTDNWEN